MTEKSPLVFPRGFVWGAATAAYQVEGAAKADGRGESIWDRFSHTEGKTLNGDTGDIACDHYHRFADDVALMKDMGLDAYRFSISWPRIIPNGRGAINWLGLDYYDRLVDALLSVGIQPYATLYHWDLPQSLQHIGGWTNRDVTGYFADYAAVMAKRLGDRVKNWMTINEPWVVAVLGNLTGEHAPGLRDKSTAIKVGHHLLVGHAKAMEAIKSCTPDAKVGITLSLSPVEAETEHEDDQRIAEHRYQLSAGLFLNPLFTGAYPTECYKEFGDAISVIQPGDMALIAKRMDFLGVQYYFRVVTGRRGDVNKVNGSKYTEMGWEVCPSALERLLVRMNDDFDLPPIFITENGAAFDDKVSDDGFVHDPERIEYFQEHLHAVFRAMKQHVHVKGYFAWSFLDNFEWQHGYSKRFGLVHVDYSTQKRIMKDSGKWYSRVARRGELEF
ncbi:MAG: beta-glucosidase [Leptolyngbya sp.]|nr:beta-glucosidase [Candidatus Melainabacteria bacterium]